MRRLLKRVLQGDPGKRSRFRDFAGRLPPPPAWLYLPHSIVTTALFKCFGHRPNLPWLGFRAIRRLRQLTAPGVAVLEFGSGLSTLWFARRGVRLVSVEADAGWHAQITRGLVRMGATNVRYILARPPYADLAGELGGPFDLVLIDGDARDECAQIGLCLLRTGGHAYLDNADVPRSSHQAALTRLLASGPAEWFTDFTPSHVFVSTGVLVRKMAASPEIGAGRLG